MTMECIFPIIGVPASLMNYLKDRNVMDDSRPLQEVLLSIPSISRIQRSRIGEFFALDVENMSLDGVVELLFHKFLAPYYKVEDGDDTILEDFRDIIGQDRSYEELIQHIVEIRKREREMKRLVYEGKEAAVISSFHAAKGVEYKITYIINASSKIMPLCRADAPFDEEEERNLAFVAASRAEKILVVTYPRIGSNGVCQVPSPYFEEFFN